jgi:hypothetical protein
VVSLPDFIFKSFEGRENEVAFIDGLSGRTLTFKELESGSR